MHDGSLDGRQGAPSKPVRSKKVQIEGVGAVEGVVSSTLSLEDGISFNGGLSPVASCVVFLGLNTFSSGIHVFHQASAEV